MSEHGGEILPHRRRTLPAPPSPSLPDNDDVLREILLRLPPLPSSLPRASLVCTRWRRLLTDPHFLRRFRAHHRRPPVLGLFGVYSGRRLSFQSILAPPDAIPPERFSLLLDETKHVAGGGGYWDFCGCRHGRVLLIRRNRRKHGPRQILVWDPVTGDHCYLTYPQLLDEINEVPFQGAVVCAGAGAGAGDEDHSCPFKVVLVGRVESEAFACVYSSETGEWGDVVRAAAGCIMVSIRNILIGNSLFWMLFGDQTAVLKFDVERQSLDVIEVPSIIDVKYHGYFLVTLEEDSVLGLLVKLGSSAHIWMWKTDFDGAAGRWQQGQTIQLDKLLSLRSGSSRADSPKIRGFAQEDNAIFVSTLSGIFMVHLESMQFKKLPQSSIFKYVVYPFTCFYPAGTDPSGGHHGAEN